MYWQIQKILQCLAYVLWGASDFICNQIPVAGEHARGLAGGSHLRSEGTSPSWQERLREELTRVACVAVEWLHVVFVLELSH